MYGIGIDTSLASADEVANAVTQQKEDFNYDSVTRHDDLIQGSENGLLQEWVR